ncbi:alkaline phosphatase [Parvibaculum sp.]|uniref:alkaline phosphatase D family protein n=1 Tax=Parvibaculum sp. TaxID=2024848 RepID=UPI00272FADF5|nr:alkaline phosphatase D family protein [Parvibaculum sp.]MDP1628115.1 alkaline phosphatase D family protein [Parvibaculum sp.]MDP2151114.1 alkaline phosphatase D family protein [Parvibaculum sp.]MDP3328581.1 alkaline phosphatase D family protein [Parvibaculum sp.]
MSGVSFNRREFLKLFAATAGCFVATAAATPFVPSLGTARAAPGAFHFPQGLASADPQPDAVMLWTRVEALAPEAALPNGDVDLYVQVSANTDFTRVVLQQAVRATRDADHTVRVFVRGLVPDTTYYYRFYAGGDSSAEPGRTRTAPRPGTKRDVRFATVSCQNYEQGYYGALRRLVNDDIAAAPGEQIDFVLHLGDFIYERTGDVPEDERPARLIGPLPDGTEPWVPDGTRPWWQKGGQAAVSLADYRALYKTYLTDPDLQAARARFPFVHTWDDHEFTNDAWQSHDTYFGDGEPAAKRKVAANKAWFEFIPAVLSQAPKFNGIERAAHDFRHARVENGELGEPDDNYLYQGTDNLKAISSLTIYRTLRWGAMLDMVITDLRSYRSPPVITKEVKAFIAGAPVPPVRLVKLLDAGRTANDGNPPETISYGGKEMPNPRANAPRGTQMGLPQKEWFKAAMKASTAKWRVWANSAPALQMRLDFSRIPFAGLEDGYVGTDAWQGYPGELAELISFLKEEKIGNVVSMAGDYHAFAAGRLPVDPDAENLSFAAVEIMTAGISSGSMYSGAARATRNSGFFHRAVVLDDAGTKRENWNNTLVNGLRAGILANYSASEYIHNMFRNERASPGLDYMDADGHGYTLVTLTETGMKVEQVNVGDVTKDAGPEGAAVLRRARFAVKPWDDGNEPALEGPDFEGLPPYPWTTGNHEA